MSTPFLTQICLCDFGRIRANRLPQLCLVCIKTIPRLEGATPWRTWKRISHRKNRRPGAPFSFRAARPRPGLGRAPPRPSRPCARPGPLPPCPWFCPSAAARFSAKVEQKKCLVQSLRDCHKTVFFVQFWPGLGALRPAAGPPPFGLRAPCARLGLCPAPGWSRLLRRPARARQTPARRNAPGLRALGLPLCGPTVPHAAACGTVPAAQAKHPPWHRQRSQFQKHDSGFA